MRSLKRIAEWYLGLREAPPGQDTDWKFSHDWPWPPWVPDWLPLLGLPILVVAIVLVYRRDARMATWKMQLGLITLRLAQIGLLLVFVSNITASVDGVELPVVVVLVDRSGSMMLDDHYSDKKDAEAVRELLKETGFEKQSRMNIQKAILLREEGRFLRRLQVNHRLQIYEFSGDAKQFDQGEFLSGDDVDQLLTLLKTRLQPDGEVTNHRAALKHVLEDLSGSPPSAIILLTDGITTTGPNDTLSESAGLAARQSVPVYLVPLGSTDPARDLQLSGILAPEVAFVSDPVTFSADLRAFGVDSKTITLTLKQKGRNEILTTKQVPVPVGGRTQRVEVIYTPSQEGDFEYILEAVPLANEANTANNRQTARVSVRQEKLKILLADSVPRYEFRYVKHLLEREKTVQLHTILQESDQEFAAEDQTAQALKGRFPIDRDKLMEYDAIILGDVDVSVLPREVLTNLDAYVRAGGSLILVAGFEHNPVGFRNTPLTALLPFELEGVRLPPEEEIVEKEFKPTLTPAAIGNPMFHLAGPGESNEAVWQQLPPLRWFVEISDLKPGAQVLLEHPTQLTNPAGREQQRRLLPIILMHRVGAGKVLFHATDELWLWRHLVGDLYYGRYWIQTLRALCRSKLLGKSREAELEPDRREYTQGQPVRLSLRFFDESNAPAEDDGVTVVVERGGEPAQRLTLQRVPHLPSVFSGELTQVAIGSYRAWVAAPALAKGAPSCTFNVIPPERELKNRNLDRVEIDAIAEKTAGEVIPISDVESLPDRIPRGRAKPLNNPESVPLWNRWELMLLFALLISGEWLLRKRLRLI